MPADIDEQTVDDFFQVRFEKVPIRIVNTKYTFIFEFGLKYKWPPLTDALMTTLSDDEVTISRDRIEQIRERVLKAEKEKLHLDLPRGINDEIEQIIKEEIN